MDALAPEWGERVLVFAECGSLPPRRLDHASLAEPNGTSTTFSYDLDNGLVRKTYADGKGFSFRYAAAVLTSRTNAGGITTTCTFDANP